MSKKIYEVDIDLQILNAIRKARLLELSESGIAATPTTSAFGVLRKKTGSAGLFWITDTEEIDLTALVGGGGVAHKFGIIKASGSVNGDFISVQDWQNPAPGLFTSIVEHGKVISATEPFKLTPTFWLLISGTIFKKIDPQDVRTIDNQNIEISMAFNSDLYVDML